MKTYFLIKPEGLKHATEIKAVMSRVGRITDVHTLQLKSQFLDRLYPNIQNGMRDQLRLHLAGQTCEAVVMVGVMDFEDLVQCAGDKKYPASCERRSVRRRFGLAEGVRVGERGAYWKNAIHRPKSSAESAKEFKFFAGEYRLRGFADD